MKLQNIKTTIDATINDYMSDMKCNLNSDEYSKHLDEYSKHLTQVISENTKNVFKEYLRIEFKEKDTTKIKQTLIKLIKDDIYNHIQLCVFINWNIIQLKNSTNKGDINGK